MNSRPYERAAEAVTAYIDDWTERSPRMTVLDIEEIIKENVVCDGAWREAFAFLAKELGIKTRMTHCSESTFDVLKAIKELKERSK